jgi:hypothetical protein
MARKNEKKLFDDLINGFSPEEIKGHAEGEHFADEILSVEDQKRLGTLIDPQYPRLAAPSSETARRSGEKTDA